MLKGVHITLFCFRSYCCSTHHDSVVQPLLGHSRQCWATPRAHWTLVCGAPPPVPLALDAFDPAPAPSNGKTNGVAKPGTQSRVGADRRPQPMGRRY
jgi:hypothetical protein